jgi:hypothetical protein
MDLTDAISEPLAKLITFHIDFNRNVKLTYGALAQLGAPATPHTPQGPVVLPNGGEPWSRSMPWRDVDETVRNAAVFISEMGIARAASAFEDYLIGVEAELDRAGARAGSGQHRVPLPVGLESRDAEPVSSLRRLVTRLRVDSAAIAADIMMAEFFDVARNCVVHRSNRASRRLAQLRASPQFASALETWPRRQGRWILSVPEVSEGEVVAWLPRHAIMASAAYYRCATFLDAAAVTTLGKDDIITMAAYWCLLSDNPVPCSTKCDAQTMVRTQLVGRYRARDVTLAEIVQGLRTSGTWDTVMQAFAARGLIKAKHAKRRIARQSKR